jgi:hypothetical protein
MTAHQRAASLVASGTVHPSQPLIHIRREGDHWRCVVAYWNPKHSVTFDNPKEVADRLKALGCPPDVCSKAEGEAYLKSEKVSPVERAQVGPWLGGEET